MSGLTDRTLRGLFWMVSGQGCLVASRTAITAVLARLLTPAAFGAVAAALTVLNFSQVFALLGVGPALIQREELEERHIRSAFLFTLLFGLATAALLWALAPLIALFFQTESVKQVLRVIVLIFPLYSLSAVGEALLQRRLRFRALVGAEVTAVLLGYGAVGITTALAGWGVWALVAAAVAQAAVRTSAILILQPFAKALRFDRRSLSELLSFGGGFTLARVLNYFALNGDYLVVGRWLGMGALGIYSKAYNLMGTLSQALGHALESVLFPSMSKMQHRPDSLATAYRRGVALTSLTLLPVSAVAWVLAPEIIAVLLGPGWGAAVLPFRILVFGSMLRASYKIGVALANATGRVYGSAWRQGLYAALVVGGAWLGQRWGLPAVALGVLVALFVTYLAYAQLSVRVLPFTWRAYLVAQAPGAWWAGFVCAETWGLAHVLRSMQLSPVLVLLVPAATVPLTMLALVRALPATAFGQDGAWFLQVVQERLRGRSRRPADLPAASTGRPR